MTRRSTILLCVGFLALALAPSAAAEPGLCVPRGDGQSLACASIVSRPGESICVAESLNPPAPGTYQASTTCAPVPCPSWLCQVAVDLGGLAVGA